MKTITLFDRTGPYAENKDVARDIRMNVLMPELEKNENIEIDFHGIQTVTQSFVHALLSEVIRKFGVAVIDKLTFKNCDPSIQQMITIVTDYMQRGSDEIE